MGFRMEWEYNYYCGYQIGKWVCYHGNQGGGGGGGEREKWVFH